MLTLTTLSKNLHFYFFIPNFAPVVFFVIIESHCPQITHRWKIALSLNLTWWRLRGAVILKIWVKEKGKKENLLCVIEISTSETLFCRCLHKMPSWITCAFSTFYGEPREWNTASLVFGKIRWVAPDFWIN